MEMGYTLCIISGFVAVTKGLIMRLVQSLRRAVVCGHALICLYSDDCIKDVIQVEYLSKHGAAQNVAL